MSDTMTAYICSAPERTLYNRIDEHLYIPEPYLPIDVVVSPTRGKAKQLFWKKYGWDVEFTEVRTRKLRDGEEGPARLVEYGDPRYEALWAAYEHLLFEEEEDADK